MGIAMVVIGNFVYFANYTNSKTLKKTLQQFTYSTNVKHALKKKSCSYCEKKIYTSKLKALMVQQNSMSIFYTRSFCDSSGYRQ